jgi:hypothetical protein
MYIAIAVRFNNTAGSIGTQRATSLLYAYLHAGEPCRFDTVKFFYLYEYIAEVSDLWGGSGGDGAVGTLGGESFLCEGHIYFERNVDSKLNIYFDIQFAWLKYFTYQLVTVLAPNYTQHILSPVKVRKASIS